MRRNGRFLEIGKCKAYPTDGAEYPISSGAARGTTVTVMAQEEEPPIFKAEMVKSVSARITDGKASICPVAESNAIPEGGAGLIDLKDFKTRTN